jgi:hypothetical protein
LKLTFFFGDETDGTVDPKIRDVVRAKIEEECNKLIREGKQVQVEMVNYDRIAERCGGETPEYLPKNRPARWN